MPKHYHDIGHVHYITFSCYRRLWLFKDEYLYSLSIKHLNISRQKTGFKLHAFIIMPNHVHLVILPPPDRKRIEDKSVQLRLSGPPVFLRKDKAVCATLLQIAW